MIPSAPHDRHDPRDGDARDDLVTPLRDARARLLELVGDLSDRQWSVPRLDIVNPILWEVGHVAWFQERWIARCAYGERPLRADGDALYDSAAVAHATRWELPLPSRSDTLAYAAATLARSAALAEAHAEDPPGRRSDYFFRLATFHEDMHGEAFVYTRQTLGYPPPSLALARESVDRDPGGGALPGDVEVPGAAFVLGARGDEPFVFDNEKWGHNVEIGTFRIARAPVTNAELAAFVDAGGYRERSWWSEAGWRWRAEERIEMPLYWSRTPGIGWRARRFDRLVDLPPNQPAVHVSWYEADAYCRWAKRRLPSEAEWELAASTPDKRRFPWGPDDSPEAVARRASLDGRIVGCVDVGAFPEGDSKYGCRQMMGNVWEWTASDFGPYPGFVIDPYAEYSAPWFSSPHKVLRGGSWATRARLLRATWRNFYAPHRRDVLAGFRTCALDAT